MFVARKPGGGSYLIPEEFKPQYAAYGFTRFDEPPRGTPLVTEPIAFDEILGRPTTSPPSGAAPAGDRIVTDPPSDAAPEPPPVEPAKSKPASKPKAKAKPKPKTKPKPKKARR